MSQWDTLARHASFYSSSDFLRYGERCPEETFKIEVSEPGHLVAGVAGWLSLGGGHPFLEPAMLLRDVGLAPAPYLVLGSPRAFFGEFLLPGAGGETRLLDAIRQHQQRTEATGAVGLYIDEASGRRMAHAAGRPPLLLGFNAAIDVPSTFDGYLNELPVRRRAKIRREISACAAAGMRVGIESIPDCVADLSPLIVESERRHGIRAERRTVHENLMAQYACYPGNVLVFTARDSSGTLCGGAVAHVDRNSVHMRILGVDKERGQAFLYFNLGYYAPLRFAAETGRAELSLGMEAFEAKLLRGARLEPRWAVDVSAEPLWNSQTATGWNRRRLAALDELLPSSIHPANESLRADLVAAIG